MSKWKVELTYRLVRQGKTAKQINRAIKAQIKKGEVKNG